MQAHATTKIYAPESFQVTPSPSGRKNRHIQIVSIVPVNEKIIFTARLHRAGHAHACVCVTLLVLLSLLLRLHLLLPSAFGTIGVKLSGSSFGLIKSVDLLLVIYGSE
uniref:Uncharacterized protein n=1 Tax=Glossina pallidipes TaxID=7398 RepID=A0A1A9ZYG3_GLOPL